MSIFRKVLVCFLVHWAIFWTYSSSACASERDVKTVIKYSVYGLVGGTAVGFGALPLTQSLRGVFIGTSVGLYLGIVVGFYQVYHRYDPQNPLHFDPPRSTSDGAPDQPEPNNQNARDEQQDQIALKQVGQTESLLTYYSHPSHSTVFTIPVFRF